MEISSRVAIDAMVDPFRMMPDVELMMKVADNVTCLSCGQINRVPIAKLDAGQNARAVEIRCSAASLP